MKKIVGVQRRYLTGVKDVAKIRHCMLLEGISNEVIDRMSAAELVDYSTQHNLYIANPIFSKMTDEEKQLLIKYENKEQQKRAYIIEDAKKISKELSEKYGCSFRLIESPSLQIGDNYYSDTGADFSNHPFLKRAKKVTRYKIELH